MPEDSFQEKTESASPKKRQQAREEGKVASSKDLNSVFLLIIAGLFLSSYGSVMMDQIMFLTRMILENLHTYVLSFDTLNGYLVGLSIVVLKILGPFFIVMFLSALLINFAQSGIMTTFKPLVPNLSKFNPVEGVKKFFNAKAAMTLFLSILKIIVVSYVAYTTVKALLPTMLLLGDMDIKQISDACSFIVFTLMKKMTIILFFLAIIDYAFQKWDHEKKMMMTKQEVKEEMKKMEGDPKIKAKIRSIQMQMARQRMMQEVPQADVIITNPIHYAVAVKYDIDEMAAPMVIAKGARILAQKIKDTAKENFVPIVENKPLAQALYKEVEVGHAIPQKLYQAVAEILAYVYQLDANKLKTANKALEPIGV